jgi:hypothetical protein
MRDDEGGVVLHHLVKRDIHLRFGHGIFRPRLGEFFPTLWCRLLSGLAAVSHVQARFKEAPMATELRNISDDYQRLAQSGLDATIRSYNEAGNGFRAFAAEITSYSKNAFDDYLRMWKQLLGSKTIEQAIQIQSQYAKTAYENHIAEMTKLGEMFSLLSRNSYKPIEQATAKAVNRLQSS